jgi:hypothetical protein
LTTNPFPLQASGASGNPNMATLTIVASNPNPTTPVTLQGLIITLPTGPNATELTTDALDIKPIAPTGWTLKDRQTPAGLIKYLFSPDKGQGDVKEDGLSFVFNKVQVNSTTGTIEVVITEGSNDCDPNSTCPTAQLYLTKFPNTWGEVLFWADPPVVNTGDGPTLRWAGPPLATYTIRYYTPQAGTVVEIPKGGDPPLSNQGQYPTQTDPPLQLTDDTTFYLSVVRTIGGQTYSAYPNVPVTVEKHEPRIVFFRITADAVTPGKPLSFTLAWQLKYVKEFQITANDGQGGQQRTLPVPGNVTSYQVSPTQLETTYTLLVVEGETMQTNQSDAGPAPFAEASAIIQAFPAGTIIAFGGAMSSLPPGWLLCDGTTFDQTKYPDLYTALGNSNTLPDLRGYFLRGLDSGGKIDPDGAGRKLLSSQQDTFARHSHVTYQAPFYDSEPYDGGHGYRSSTGAPYTDYRHQEPSSQEGSAETRPKNVAINYLIFAGLLRQSA